jgi:DNA repair protein RadD
MTFSIDDRLRDYQKDAIDELRLGLAGGVKSQMLYAPTGAGKTEIAIALMEYARRKGRKAAMILDRIVLVDQTSKRLHSYGIPHGVQQAGHPERRPYERVQICSAHTLEKRGYFPELDLLIVDEAHQIRTQTKQFIKNHPDIAVIGLSATPFTKGLKHSFSKVVNSVTTEYLVDKGMLAPLRVFLAKEIDMTGAAKVGGEWSSAAAEERGIKLTGDIVSEWVSKTHQLFGGPRKTIVFCASVAHGADLAEKFASAGYNFVPVSYKDDDEYKKDVFREFSKPDSVIHGLIAVDILTKGFDVPDVMIGVSARPFTKSLSSHIQQMGRVMRSCPGKEFAVWLDHSGNYLRFHDDWDGIYSDGPGELDDGREKAKREPTAAEKEAAKCPKCGALWGRGSSCPHCGFVSQRQSLIVVQPGRMEEFGKKATKKEKQQFYRELLHHQIYMNYKPGWVAKQYKDKFKVWPRGMDGLEPTPPTKLLEGWLQHNRIAYIARLKAMNSGMAA